MWETFSGAFMALLKAPFKVVKAIVDGVQNILTAAFGALAGLCHHLFDAVERGFHRIMNLMTSDNNIALPRPVNYEPGGRPVIVSPQEAQQAAREAARNIGNALAGISASHRRPAGEAVATAFEDVGAQIRLRLQ